MTYSFDISHRDDLIHAGVSGVLDDQAIRELWAAIVKACDAHDCYNILGVSDLDRPFSTVEAFGHIEVFKDVGITWRHRIAWVSKDANSEDILRFTETLLVNRGLVNGAVFNSIEEAEHWLRNVPDANP